MENEHSMGSLLSTIEDKLKRILFKDQDTVLILDNLLDRLDLLASQSISEPVEVKISAKQNYVIPDGERNLAQIEDGIKYFIERLSSSGMSPEANSFRRIYSVLRYHADRAGEERR